MFQTAFLNAPAAMLLVDDAGNVVASNHAFCNLCAMNQHDIVGLQLSAILTVEQGELSLLNGWTGIGLINGDPSIGNERAMVSIYEAMGAESGFLVAFSPEGETAKPSLAQDPRAEKLASLGSLAGGVAHDLNNLLTGVLGHVSYLRLALSDDETCSDSLVAIEDGARRAAAMTQQILKFARDDANEGDVVNFSSVVSSAGKLLLGAMPSRIQLVVTGPDGDLFVHGDESRLSQLVVNLAVNARDAITQIGKINMSLDKVLVDSEFCSSHIGTAPGEYVRLQITDDGEGISPEVKNRIFEPFFTTKEKSGTGIGLATVCDIVQQHSGAIECHSQVGAGTTFAVFLPVSQEELSAEADSFEEALPRGSERVLVVDDEEVVRTVIQRSLEHLGYRVDVAENGPDALSRFRHDAGSYSLVILDMMMPRMAGDEVFRKLQELDKGVKVLLVSGYTSEGRARSVLDNGGRGFIQKPFAVEDLAREVRRCLDEG